MLFLSAISLPPPRNWQDFEDLCCDLWSRLWNDPEAQKIGRGGQAQQGVDICGRPDRGSEWAAVQCKLKDRQALSREEIEKEVVEARKFEPQLSRLVIATTAPRDARLQATVRKIDETERNAGSFSVTVFFWEDIVLKLGYYPEVVRKYYSSLFPRLGTLANQPPPQELEVVLKADKEWDYIAMIPAYSSIDPASMADLAVLAAGLSEIEIINHGDKPTTILRLWIGIKEPGAQGEIKPQEIKKEDLVGTRRIEARSRQRYRLDFDALFEGAPRQDWRERVMLGVKAIGIGELHVGLEDFFL
jgi:Mrr restriction endonuclease-like protein